MSASALHAGLANLEKVVAMQWKHTQPGRRIENDLQTNGTLRTDA
jgi:sulfatase maturation enzyme AslB (radical SAM superfamily)